MEKKKCSSVKYPLMYRRASLEDAKMLYDWRVDPETCNNSLSGPPIDATQHKRWLKTTLANDNQMLLIAYAPVGTVRYDSIPARQEAYMSWTICPRFRGMGLASQMVKELISANNTYKDHVMAWVKVGNEASIKVAKKAGMKLIARLGQVMLFSNQKDRDVH